jgi:hypothetical protein
MSSRLACRLRVGKLNLLRRNLQAPACVESDFSGYAFLVAETSKPFELGLVDYPTHQGYALRAICEIPNRRFDPTFEIADQYVPEFLERRKWNRRSFHFNPICSNSPGGRLFQ